jgi:hypothetical protein
MRIGRLVLYPFLIAPYPIIALYAQNSTRAPAAQVVWPVVLVTAASALVWGALRLATSSPAKAGLVTVVVVAFFNTASLAHEWVDECLRSLSWLWVARDFHVWPPFVVASELVAAVLLGHLALTRLSNPDAWTPRLNLLAVFLMVMPLGRLVVTHTGEPPTAAGPPLPLIVGGPPSIAGEPPAARSRPPNRVTTTAQSTHCPDIYYIILDGYARSDVMFDLFGFDNEPFLKHLECKGFYVARQSTANYCQTPLSLSSALNAVYLNGLIPPTSHDLSQLGDWISHGAVVKTLQELGYRFVTFATGFAETDHPEADIYLAPSPYLSPFHHLLVSRTALAWLLPNPGLRDGYIAARERTTFLLATVPRIARWRQSTFTFAHVVAPHPPFIFGSNGEDVSPHERLYYLTDGELFRDYYGASDYYATGYRNQAMFLTKQVELMIDGILANSAEPPLIILQSDHGSGLRLDTKSVDRTDLHERMSILNAYYVPARVSADLYQSISPVNSFRVIFNAYFGAKLGLLPDRSYYSSWDDPFQFIEVTDQVRVPHVPDRSPFSALTRRSVDGPAISTPSHAGPRGDLRRREAGP